MNRKRAVIIVTVVGAIAAAAAYSAGWFRRDDSLQGSGTVEARDIRVGSKIAGRIDKVMVREGDTVQAGQVLITFDDRELMATLQQSQASAQKAQRGRIVTALRGGLPILVRPGGDRSSKANGKDERGYRCFQRVFHIHRGCGLDDCPASFGKPTDRTIPIEPIHLPGSSLLSCAT